MIFVGTRLYGKVDQVPGLFHLATEFFHIQFVPIGPSRSYVVLEGSGNRGIRVRLSGKSILFAYLRAFILVVCLCAVLVGFNDEVRRRSGTVVALSIAAACMPLFFLTYFLSRPGPI